MIKYSLILLFIFCVNFPLFSQTTTSNKSKIALQIDSLNNIAKTLVVSNPDSVLSISSAIKQIPKATSCPSSLGITYMYESYAYYFKSENEKARSSIKEAILILSKSNDKHSLGFSYNQLASLEESFGEIEDAKTHFDKAIDLMEQVENPTRLHVVYNNLGVFHQRQGNYLESIKNYTKALEMAEKHQNKSAIAACLSNIGNIYFYQLSYRKALEYYLEAEIIQKEIQDIRSLGLTYNNIAGVYMYEEKYQEAIPILHNALVYRNQLGDTKGSTLTTLNLSISFRYLHKYDSSDYYNQKALDFQKQTNDLHDLTIILMNMTESQNLRGNYDKALEYANKGYKISQELKSLANMSEFLQYKANILAKKGEYKAAFEAQALYYETQDSIYNLEKASEINAVLLDRKELENDRLEQDNAFKIIALEKETLQRQTKDQQFSLLEKQAEADQLLGLAKDATNKQQADSLYRAAQNAQLEADNLKIKSEKAEAEKRATKAESDQKIAFQRNLSILFGMGILAAFMIAYIAYRNQRNKQKANLLLAEKNKEINLQNNLLANSNQTKDRLFSIIAHDLRSPIAAFQSTSRQISFFLQKNKPERIKEIGNQIEMSSQNLSNMLNNLLHWALTQQNNHIKINKEEISIAQSIEQTFKSYQIIATANDISLESSITEDTFGFVDKDCFQTILRNLIGNALKYTPEGGKINLSATIQKNTVVLKVKDTGIGMSDEVKEKLFQLNVANTSRGIRGEKGTGLGLVLCYEFAKLNDIEIDVESKEGQGTTFLLTIPMS